MYRLEVFVITNNKKYFIGEDGKQHRWFTARQDIVFKTIFGGIENKEMLEKLLSTIFKEKVEIIAYLTNELPNTFV